MTNARIHIHSPCNIMVPALDSSIQWDIRSTASHWVSHQFLFFLQCLPPLLQLFPLLLSRCSLQFQFQSESSFSFHSLPETKSMFFCTICTDGTLTSIYSVDPTMAAVMESQTEMRSWLTETESIVKYGISWNWQLFYRNSTYGRKWNIYQGRTFQRSR